MHTLRFSLLALLLCASLLAGAQDYADAARQFKSLKGLQAWRQTAAKDGYECLLAKGGFLSIQYNVVESGEYNATYTFWLPKERGEDKPAARRAACLAQLPRWCAVLGLTAAQQQKLLARVRTEAFVQRSTVIALHDILGYDECLLVFRNDENVGSWEFFFRRIL